MSRESSHALVFHPGRQHSERLVAALDGCGIRTTFWYGSLASNEPRAASSHSSHRSARRLFPLAPTLRRVFGAVGRRSGEKLGDFLGSRWFDRWVARRIEGSEFDLVVGYEAGCARTFETARRRGVATLLDAASLHHGAQDRWRVPEEPPWVHRRIVAVKEREIRAADRIVVASSVAAASYREAGVSDERLRVVPLGVDLDTFRPLEREETATLRLLFVGKPSRTKGFDLLLAAFEVLRRSGLEGALRVVAQGSWAGPIPRGVECGSVPHERLAEVYSAADLLVLPSRFDGFGLVVSEALACGTPVLVSNRVGAADLVRDGVNGWIVEAGSEEALRARLEWCARHPEAVRALRPACRSSVLGCDWASYGRGIVGVVRELLAERRA